MSIIAINYGRLQLRTPSATDTFSYGRLELRMMPLATDIVIHGHEITPKLHK